MTGNTEAGPAPEAPIQEPSDTEVATAEPVDPAAEPGPASSEELDEVTVVGTRVQNTAGSAHVIGTRKLERYRYDDPLALVRTVPGVYVRTEDGMGLRPNIGLRGANADRSKKITLMEDGVLTSPAPYSAPAAYYLPLIERMTQVRVIKGSSSISYGPQTVGGAIDFMSRAVPSSTSASADLAFGSYGYNKLHGFVGTSDGQTGFLVEGVHLGNTGFKQLPNDANTGFHRNEVLVKASHVIDPRASVTHELRLKLVYSEEESNETYLGLTRADLEKTPRRRYAASALDHMSWHHTTVVAEHEMKPARDVTLTTTAYRHDFARTWRKLNAFRGANLFDVLNAPDTAKNAVFYSVLTGGADSSTPAEALLIGPNQRDFVSQGIQTRVRFDTHGVISQRIEYGMRLHYDRIERRHSEDAFQMLGGELVPEGSPTRVTTYNQAWTEAFAFHASDALTFRRLTVTPGLRVELMRSELFDKIANTKARGTAQVILPGIGLYQGFTEDFGVLAGVHRGFSPPPPGNSEQQGPELSVNYEAGLRFGRGSTRAEAIGYYNDYSNLTDVCTLSSGCLDANLDRQYDAGRARIYGIESYVEHELTLGPVTVPFNASYTYTRAKFSESFISDDPVFGNVFENDDMPYVPRHQFNGTVAVEIAQAHAHITGTYVSRMRERAGRGAFDDALSTDPELMFDVGAGVRPFPWLEIYGSIRNLTDTQPLLSRRPFGARSPAPRWFLLGAKASY